MTRQQQLLDLLARYPDGLTYGTIASAMDLSADHVKELAHQAGPALRRWKVDRRVRVALSAGELMVRADPVAAPPPAPTRAAPVSLDGRSPELRRAARILNALPPDKRADPRYLACQGGYSYTRARAIHAELTGAG